MTAAPASVRPGGRRTSPTVPLAAVVLVGALVLLGPTTCGRDDADDLAFVDDVRNRYPELSVADISDGVLLDLADAACGPDGLSDEEAARLVVHGIEVSTFVSMAQPLCPSR